MPSTALQIVPIGPSELAHHLDALAELLCACVRNGASVSFIVPFGVDEARAFWSDQVAPSLACKKRTMLIALVEGELAGTVQLDLDMPPNQQHRAEVA